MRQRWAEGCNRVAVGCQRRRRDIFVETQRPEFQLRQERHLPRLVAAVCDRRP